MDYTKLPGASVKPLIAAPPDPRQTPDQMSTTSAMGSFKRGAVRGATPAAIGLAAGIPGAEAGATFGFGVGGPPGAAIGGVIGGLFTGIPAAYAASYAQEKVFEANPNFAASLGQSPEQRAIDMQEHPYASFAGEIAPNLAAFRPSLSTFSNTAKLGARTEAEALAGGASARDAALQAATAQAKVRAQRINAVVNAGVSGAVDLGHQMASGEQVDLTKTAMAAGLGLLGQKETFLGRGVVALGRKLTPPSVRERADVLFGRVQPDSGQGGDPTPPNIDPSQTPPATGPIGPNAGNPMRRIIPTADGQRTIFDQLNAGKIPTENDNSQVAPPPAPKSVNNSEVFQVSTEDGGVMGVTVYRLKDGSVQINNGARSTRVPKEMIGAASNEEVLRYVYGPIGFKAAESMPSLGLITPVSGRNPRSGEQLPLFSQDQAPIPARQPTNVLTDGGQMDLFLGQQPVREAPQQALPLQSDMFGDAGPTQPDLFAPANRPNEQAPPPPAARGPGEQTDMFGGDPNQPDLFAPANRPNEQAPPPPAPPEGRLPRQRDMLDETPEAFAAADFDYRGVLQRLRSAWAGKGKPLETTTSEQLREAQALSAILRKGDPAELQAYLADLERQQRYIETSPLKPETIAKRQRMIDAKRDVIEDYFGRMDDARRQRISKQAEVALDANRPGARIDRAPEDVGATEQQMRDRNTRDQAREDAQAEREAVGFTDSVVEGARQQRTTATRDRILEDVLADENTQNPEERFKAALRARGIRDLNLTEAELAKIDRWRGIDEATDQPYQNELFTNQQAPNEGVPADVPRSARPAEQTVERAAPETGETGQAEMFTRAGKPTAQAKGESRAQLVAEADAALQAVKGKVSQGIMQKAYDAFMQRTKDIGHVREVAGLLKSGKVAAARKLVENAAPEAPKTPPKDPASERRRESLRGIVDEGEKTGAISKIQATNLRSELSKDAPDFDVVERKVTDAVREYQKKSPEVEEPPVTRDDADEAPAPTDEDQQIADYLRRNPTPRRYSSFDDDTNLSRSGKRRKGSPVERVRAAVDQVTSTWKKAPPIEVVQSVDDLPISAPPDTDGLYHNGKLYLVGDNIHSDGHAKAVLFHEGLGHFGLKGRFGKELAGIIRDAYKTNDKFKAAVDRWMEANLDTPEARKYYSRFSEEKLLEIAGEEVLAEMSERGPAKYDKSVQGVLDRVAAAVRTMARKMGLNMKYSHEDMFEILRQAHKYTTGGGRAPKDGEARLSYTGDNALHSELVKQNKATAMIMEKVGADKDAIRVSTGWFRNPYDKKWRYEIPDNVASWKTNFRTIPLDNAKYKSMKVGDVFSHDELFKLYPEAKDILFEKIPGSGEEQANYNPELNRIRVYSGAIDPLGSMLHELQHWVQNKEGFARGTNPNKSGEKATIEQIRRYAERLARKTEQTVASDEKEAGALKARIDRIEGAYKASKRMGIFSGERGLDLLLDNYRRAEKQYRDAAKRNEELALADNTNQLYLDSRALRAKTYAEMNRTAAELDQAIYPEYVNQQTGQVDIANLPEDIRYAAYFLKNQKSTIAEHLRNLQSSYARLNDAAQKNRALINRLRNPASDEMLRQTVSIRASDSMYRAYAGEIEARDTAARKGMTPKEREEKSPYTKDGAYEYASEDVIVDMKDEPLSARLSRNNERSINDGDLPDTVKQRFWEVGNKQRGNPEVAMMNFGQLHNGYMQWMTEHVGDLTHRMTEMIKWGADYGYGREYMIPKVTKALRELTDPYGFERNVESQMDSNVRSSKLDKAAYMAKFDKALQKYAAEHKKLPVYNRAQWLGREAAVAIGEKRFNDATKHLRELDRMLSTQEIWNKEATKYQVDDSGEPLPYDGTNEPSFQLPKGVYTVKAQDRLDERLDSIKSLTKLGIYSKAEAADARKNAELIAELESSRLSRDKRKVVLIHGGADFDKINPAMFGTGEPGGIRPLGDGLYGYVVHDRSREELAEAIRGAARYAKKYGRGNKTVHAFTYDMTDAYVGMNGRGDDRLIGVVDAREKATDAAYERANALPVGPERSAAFDEARALARESDKIRKDLRIERLPIDLTEAAVPAYAANRMQRLAKYSLDDADKLADDINSYFDDNSRLSRSGKFDEPEFLDSEGRLVHPTVEGRKNFFNKYAAKKPAVTENGVNPLLLRHGTTQDFNDFVMGWEKYRDQIKDLSKEEAAQVGGGLFSTRISTMLGAHVAPDPEITSTFSFPGTRNDLRSYESNAYDYKKWSSIGSDFVTGRRPQESDTGGNNLLLYGRGKILDLRGEKGVDDAVVARAVAMHSLNPEYIAGALQENGHFEVNKTAAQEIMKSWESSDYKLPRWVEQAVGSALPDIKTKRSFVNNYVRSMTGSRTSAPAARMALDFVETSGYDGIVYTNTSPMETLSAKNTDSYIFFHPNDLKSALGNSGEFSEARDVRLSRNLEDSTGAPVYPTEEGQQNFKQFFGKSQVVDDQGRPLRMYTGTSKDKEFKSINVPRNGAWFSKDPNEASMYAMSNDSMGTKLEWRPGKSYPDFIGTNTASRVMPVYLRIEKPYRLTDAEAADYQRSGNYKKWQANLGARLRAEGYDGIDWGGGVWSVIGDSSQIKSAIGNDGSFAGTRLSRSGANRMRAAAEAEALFEGMPESVREPTRKVWDNISYVGKRGITSWAFTPAIADDAVKAGVTAADDYVLHMQEREKIKKDKQIEVENVLNAFEALPEHLKGTGSTSVNRLIYDSTTESKWAFTPDWIENFDQKNIDPNLQIRFNALPKSAQDVVKSVFRYGHTTLREMKNGVLDTVAAEYRQRLAYTNEKLVDAYDQAYAQGKDVDARDATLSAFEAAMKQAQGTEYEKLVKASYSDLKADLAKFYRLLSLHENSPYAPKRRFGKYVVMGYSKKYAELKDAVERGEAKQKALDELKGSPNDYFVDFATTAGEAQGLQRELAQRFGKDNTTWFEKERAGYQGGDKDLYLAFQRLNRLMTDHFSEVGDKTALNKARQLVSDLYLSTLFETSSRKSEFRRLNVSGREMDMMRSFASKGLADAHFIGNLYKNNDVLRSISKMQKQVSERNMGRAQRAMYVNELLTRHAMTMASPNMTIANVINRASSVWFLAMSPAYYLQNITQPMMMSVPYMAGRHGYPTSMEQFWRAYKELAPMIKAAKATEPLDLTKNLPKDVENVLRELILRGQIDIGIDTDLGSWASQGNGKLTKHWNAVDRGLRNLVQKTETINRLATGMAAYRSELASLTKQGIKGKRAEETALKYASDVITTTHGNYDAFSAPRYFNTPTGKVALQFRKFQLIQIAMLAKLARNSFQSGPEALIARKALGFTLAHATAMAGAAGIPGWMAIKWLYSKLAGDENEPKDLEKDLREAIGDERLATMLLRGAPAAGGMDMSNRVGFGNTFSLFPYADIKGADRESYANLLMAAAGPAIGGLLPRGVDAMGYMARGDYYRGVETLLPTGMLQGAAKSYRLSQDGVTKQNGQVLIPPEDLDEMTLALTALGMPSTELSSNQWAREVERNFSQFYADRSAQIKLEYVRARVDGDKEAVAQAMQDWLSLQASRRKNGLKTQPVSQLMDAYRDRLRNQRRTKAGIEQDAQNRGLVNQLAEMTDGVDQTLQ